jgi:prepilin-type N-terminal cleavage/methylation domain-containing protein
MMMSKESVVPGNRVCPLPPFAGADQGFSLVEFMVSSLILLVIAGSVFSLLSQTQRTASYQVEVQGVLENTRFGMMTLERILQQAGNDPFEVGITGIGNMTSTQVRVQSDLTGSGSTATPPEPDKGDPDGDALDAGEDVTISYDENARTINLNGQPLASNISAFSLQFFDKNGTITGTGANVTRIRMTVTGQSPVNDPQTGRPFSMELASDVKLFRLIK